MSQLVWGLHNEKEKERRFFNPFNTQMPKDEEKEEVWWSWIIVCASHHNCLIYSTRRWKKKNEQKGLYQLRNWLHTHTSTWFIEDEEARGSSERPQLDFKGDRHGTMRDVGPQVRGWPFSGAIVTSFSFNPFSPLIIIIHSNDDDDEEKENDEMPTIKMEWDGFENGMGQESSGRVKESRRFSLLHKKPPTRRQSLSL